MNKVISKPGLGLGFMLGSPSGEEPQLESPDFLAADFNSNDFKTE